MQLGLSWKSARLKLKSLMSFQLKRIESPLHSFRISTRSCLRMMGSMDDKRAFRSASCVTSVSAPVENSSFPLWFDTSSNPLWGAFLFLYSMHSVASLSWWLDDRLTIGSKHMNFVQGNTRGKELPNDFLITGDLKRPWLIRSLLMVTANHRITIA